MDPKFPRVWRLTKAKAGSGALGDIASHSLDLARYLVGEIDSVCGLLETFVAERPLPDGSGRGPVDVDDAALALLRFEDGAVGSVEGSRFAPGRNARDWKAAIEALQKSAALYKGDFLSINGFFLAMAHWQLGHKDEARDWYDKSVQWMEKNRPDDQELIRFRAQAAALLDLPVVAPIPQKRDNNDSEAGEPAASAPSS